MAEVSIEPGSEPEAVGLRMETIHAQMEEGLKRSGMFFYILDSELRLQFISASAARSLGRGRSEVIGKTLEEIGVPDDVCKTARQLVNAALTGGKAIHGFLETKVKGTELFEYDLAPIFEGGSQPSAVLALVFDRTAQALERKALEAIARINDFVRMSMDEKELVRKTIDAVAGALNDDALAMVVRNGDEWTANHSLKLSPDDERELSDEVIRIASNFIGGRRADAIIEASKDPRVSLDIVNKYGGGSMLIVPARVSDAVSIVLVFVRMEVRPFSKDEMSLGEKIASSVAVAIKDQLVLQELKRSNMERENLMVTLARESEMLTSILDATPVAIGVFQSDGEDYRLTLCNSVFRRGVPLSVPRPLEGKLADELSRPEEVAFGRKMVEEALRTGRTQVRQDSDLHFGEDKFPAQVLVTPISKDPPAFLLVAVDVSELVNARKQLEEYAAKIEAERARLRAMIDSLPVGVVLVDANGKVLEANDKRTEVWGKGVAKDCIVDGVRGVRAKWSNNGMPVPKDGWPITRALKNGEFIKGEMVDIIRPDGRHGTELLSAAPIHDSKGGRIGAVGIVQDVTEQRQLEHDALEAKERAEMYLDLLTHDIQGHNAAISGYIQISMAKDKQGKRKDELRKALDSINSSSELIDTMRKIQQVEMHDDSHGQIELTSMLEEVISDVQVVGGERTHIETITKPESYAMASPMIREAFWNILINAVKHSEGEVHITVRQNRSYDGGREYHKFIIEDDGPGIPDDVKPKVFLRKYRGRTRAQGSGLGLYLTKRLVEEHGGRVWVEDRVPGDHARGARFIMHIPAVATCIENQRPVPGTI